MEHKSTIKRKLIEEIEDCKADSIKATDDETKLILMGYKMAKSQILNKINQI